MRVNFFPQHNIVFCVTWVRISSGVRVLWTGAHIGTGTYVATDMPQSLLRALSDAKKNCEENAYPSFPIPQPTFDWLQLWSKSWIAFPPFWHFHVNTSLLTLNKSPDYKRLALHWGHPCLNAWDLQLYYTFRLLILAQKLPVLLLVILLWRFRGISHPFIEYPAGSLFADVNSKATAQLRCYYN